MSVRIFSTRSADNRSKMSLYPKLGFFGEKNWNLLHNPVHTKTSTNYKQKIPNHHFTQMPSLAAKFLEKLTRNGIVSGPEQNATERQTLPSFVCLCNNQMHNAADHLSWHCNTLHNLHTLYQDEDKGKKISSKFEFVLLEKKITVSQIKLLLGNMLSLLWGNKKYISEFYLFTVSATH